MKSRRSKKSEVERKCEMVNLFIYGMMIALVVLGFEAARG